MVKIWVDPKANQAINGFFGVCNPGVPGVGAAVQTVQSAAEQGLSAAMMKMQVRDCVNQ